MAIIYVDANGVGTPDDWELVAGSSKVAAVSFPDDDGASFIRKGDPVGQQVFTCAPGLAAGDVITYVTVRARARHTVNACNFRIGYAFTPSGGGSQTAESGTLVTSSNFSSFTFTDSGLSVPWGSNFTFWIRNTQTRLIQCTTLYVEIAYTPGATVAAGPLVSTQRLKSKLRGLI